MIKTLVVVGALAVSASAFAQSTDNCILAGRLNAEDKLANKFAGVELLNAQGKAIAGLDKATLETVKQVRVSKPALLSVCNGASAVKSIEPQAGAAKPAAQVVTASATPIAVDKVSLLGLKTGGSLLELQLALAADRVSTK